MIPAAVALLAAAWYVATGNRFKRMQVEAEQARAGIEAALMYRGEILAQLLAWTKTPWEPSRVRGQEAAGLTHAAQQMDLMTAQLRMTLTGEPALLADGQLQMLLRSLRDAELQLAAARERYNACVLRFNTGRSQFPNSIVAGRFAPFAFFEAEMPEQVDFELRF